MANQYLQEPKIITELKAIRARLEGSDRDDHIAEVEGYATQAAEALLKLSMSDNAGMKMLLEEAKGHLLAAYEMLTVKPKAFDTEYLNRQNQLYAMIEVWNWFLDFFNQAERVKQEIEDFITKNLVAPQPEDQEY